MQTKAIAITALIASLGSLPAFAEPRDRETLVLKMVDTYNVLPIGAKAAARQVEKIFAGVGVSVRWTEPSTSAIPQRGQAELLVYIRAHGPEGLGLDARAMGVVLDKTTPQRILFVFLPSIARTMGIELGGMLGAEAERRLASALSQVIAHEAFHAIAPDLPHAGTGLTAANLTRDFLLKSDPAIEARAASVFRKELAKLWTQAEQQVVADDTP